MAAATNAQAQIVVLLVIRRPRNCKLIVLCLCITRTIHLQGVSRPMILTPCPYDPITFRGFHESEAEKRQLETRAAMDIRRRAEEDARAQTRFQKEEEVFDVRSHLRLRLPACTPPACARATLHGTAPRHARACPDLAAIQRGGNFFILGSRRVLAPAPKVQGSDKTHLKSRFCVILKNMGSDVRLETYVHSSTPGRPPPRHPPLVTPATHACPHTLAHTHTHPPI